MTPAMRSWIDALRSGEYRQGQYTLRQIDRQNSEHTEAYCCLGVLCDLHSREDLNGSWSPLGDDGCAYKYQIYGSNDMLLASTTSTLPFEVAQWAEIDQTFETTLVNLNDNRGMDFDDIADIIEQRYSV